jgi:hypothetical protein
MGFESNFPSTVDASSHHAIVRSLFSIGYFGDFYLLRPHAFEFYEKLRTKRQFTKIEDKEQFKERASAFIARTGITEILEKLSASMHQHSLRSSSGDRKFLDILTERPGEVFSIIEQINGTWSQRLRHLFDKKRLRLDKLGPETSQLVLTQHDTLYQINDLILKDRPQLSLNAFQDASALTILRKYISDWETGTREFVARFYTETATLDEALRSNEDLLTLLSYPESVLQTEQYMGCCKHVYRDSNYFIMRALFDELATANRLPPEKLVALEGLQSQLEALLKDEGVDIERAINAVQFEDRYFPEWLERFENVSITEPLWVMGGLDEILPQSALAPWVNVFEYAKGQRIKVLLNADIKDVRRKFESHVSKMGLWVQDYKTISRARKARLKYLESIDDPMRDLGLVRWNFDLSDNQRDRIVSAIRNLGDESNVSVIVSAIATDMETARRHLATCEYVGPVLWALGRFNEIDLIIAECRRNNPNHFPPSLTAIQLAARIRSGKAATEVQRERIVNDVSLFLGKLRRSEARGILLSIGYVYFHAWDQATVGADYIGRQWANQSDLLHKWAQEALSLGEQAKDAYPENTLPWAYAVNHCAYVTIMTDIDDAKKGEYITKLLRLRTNEELWCSRFDDTAGCYYLDLAQKKWYLTPDHTRQNIDISADLERAKEYLESAKERDTGDTAVHEHLSALDVLTHEFETQTKHT